MNIAILGYGKMGKAIESIAVERGHTIVYKGNAFDINAIKSADIAIDFSIPEAAVTNISKCLEGGIPIVSGTTGWLDQYDEMTSLCSSKEGAFLYASNFSVGVNLFFELNKKLAQLMNNQSDYAVSMEEIHHTQKLDAPSGTAISLAEDIVSNSHFTRWKLEDNEIKSSVYVPIHSKRIGTVPGTHIIDFKSTIDTIRISHEAHSRQGFALGAVIAAEWLVGKKGVFSMSDVLNIS